MGGALSTTCAGMDRGRVAWIEFAVIRVTSECVLPVPGVVDGLIFK
jgi:hypothetical protein